MKKIIGVAMIMGMVGGAQATLIALWENDGLQGTNAGPVSANSLGVNVESAELGRGAGATPSTYNNTLAMRNRTETSLANAIANDRYFYVEVEAADGYWFNFDSIFLRLEANNIANGAQVALFSNHTGFNAGDELWSIDLYDGGDGPGQFSTHTVSLDGESDLQNVASAEFRIYTWGGTGEWDAFAIGRGFQTNGDDDLVLNGTIELIPEPGTLALLGMGLFGILSIRRRLARA